MSETEYKQITDHIVRFSVQATTMLMFLNKSTLTFEEAFKLMKEAYAKDHRG